MSKSILVTGGNTGIGFALCRQLVCDKGCRVFLGSRDLTKGEAAAASIREQSGAGGSGSVELVQIDTSSDQSVKKAGEDLVARGLLKPGELYAIVNNAGAGLGHGVSDDVIINTNLMGPKRVCEAFIPFLDPKHGRIVNVGSGAGPSHVGGATGEDRKRLISWETKWDHLMEYVERQKAENFPGGGMGSYGTSKACLTVYGMILAQQYPQFMVSTLSPGYINTNMTAGFGATKSPEEGTVALHHCLFDDLKGSGFYYGSDGLRSPLTFMRNPGEPEYNGEPEE